MPVHIPGFSGGDRTDITLPAAQQQLLEAAKATGKPLIVVLMNGSALAVNWSQQKRGRHPRGLVPPGDGGAQAIAETLAGANNPAGRLPVTFYASLDQLPSSMTMPWPTAPIATSRASLSTDSAMGLSYTTFAYSNLKLSTNNLRAGDTLTVEADVKNTGQQAGEEVAELYLTPPHTNVSPNLALDGFTRVQLSPGETKHITLTLDPRTLSQVDDKGIRAVTAGSYKIAIGSAQPTETANTQTANFAIEGTQEMPR